MKASRFARSLLRILAALAVLAAFSVLDWYPTVRELGRLRRQRGDLAAKMKNYSAMAAGFVFPDAREEMFFHRGEKQLRRALPPVDDDHAWAAMAMIDLQSRVMENQIPHARFMLNLFLEGTGLGTARTQRFALLDRWFRDRIQESPAGIIGRDRFPWQGLLSGLGSDSGQRLASRTVALVLAAPLPALLHFVNRVSWGSTRLEIIGLRLDPGVPLSFAWVVCRGSYQVKEPSVWLVEENEAEEARLLIDLDSPLLLQKVDPVLAPRIEKRELPPAGSPW